MNNDLEVYRMNKDNIDQKNCSEGDHRFLTEKINASFDIKSHNHVTILDSIRQDKEFWDIFTKREEYAPILLDRYERFPYYISNNKNNMEPVVSKILINNGLEIQYPEGKKFAVCLTHDIDQLRYADKIGTVIGIATSLYHFRINEALKRPFYNINKSWNPVWNFEKIMSLEEQYGAKSSFYFMGLEKEDLDFNYRIEELSNEMGKIIDRGWEIGLHGGHGAYNSLKVIKKEKARLERVLGKTVTGYRNHYLRFKVPDTWELLREAGFKYDATFGYAHCAGFRNGLCHPFKPFNLKTNNYIDILEVPLIIMDCTLFDYMRLDMNGAWSIIESLINITERYHGIITILWHNDYMTGDNFKLYNKLLQYIYDKNAYISSIEDVLINTDITYKI